MLISINKELIIPFGVIIYEYHDYETGTLLYSCWNIAYSDTVTINYLMIGKILGFWLVNWHVIWSCINRSESCINLLVFVCMYVCSFLLPVQRSRRQSWDKFVINCFGVWYNLYLAIRRLYHPRLRLGWYSHLIARYKLYHTPKQLITNIII